MKIKESIVSFLKKKWWYLILLIASSIYVWVYRHEIYQLKEFNAMNLVFILWLVLLLLPLFSELEFFGVKLKKEVEKAKSEVKENLNDLRLQLMDLKISNSIANTIQIGSAPLASEKELGELKKMLDEMRSESKESGKEVKDVDFGVSEQSTYLFKARLGLEKVLSELCEKTDYSGNKNMRQMLRHLNMCELINGATADLISQVIQIANRGVHGEIVSKEYIDFVQQALPEVHQLLEEANSRLHHCICPRCKYSGYSRFENVCPNCGYTHDSD